MTCPWPPPLGGPECVGTDFMLSPWWRNIAGQKSTPSVGKDTSRGKYESIEWNDAAVERGSRGNHISREVFDVEIGTFLKHCFLVSPDACSAPAIYSKYKGAETRISQYPE